MKFESITSEQLAEETRYLEFRFAPIWQELEKPEVTALRIPVENGQTVKSMTLSLRYAAKAMKKKVRFLASRDRKSVLVVKS